jgi:hypothetical protein
MKKNWSHTHPAVMAWTPEMEQAKRRGELMEPHLARWKRAQKRKDRIERIEGFVGFLLLIWSFPTTIWMTENNAPEYISIPAFFAMWLASLALLMESSRDDDLS